MYAGRDLVYVLELFVVEVELGNTIGLALDSLNPSGCRRDSSRE